jgi:hypothetical protein
MSHPMILALLFFLIGSALHTLAQIDAIARAKNGGSNSRMVILQARWSTILNRGAWSIAFFTLWLQGQLVALLTVLHIPLPNFATAMFDLHIGGAVAFMAGYVSDSALAFIPGLNNSLPPSIDTSFGSQVGTNPQAKVDASPPKG